MQPIQYCVHAPKFLILKTQVLPISGGDVFLKNLKKREKFTGNSLSFLLFLLKFSFVIAGIR